MFQDLRVDHGIAFDHGHGIYNPGPGKAVRPGLAEPRVTQLAAQGDASRNDVLHVWTDRPLLFFPTSVLQDEILYNAGPNKVATDRMLRARGGVGILDPAGEWWIENRSSAAATIAIVEASDLLAGIRVAEGGYSKVTTTATALGASEAYGTGSTEILAANPNRRAVHVFGFNNFPGSDGVSVACKWNDTSGDGISDGIQSPLVADFLLSSAASGRYDPPTRFSGDDCPRWNLVASHLGTALNTQVVVVSEYE